MFKLVYVHICMFVDISNVPQLSTHISSQRNSVKRKNLEVEFDLASSVNEGM